MYPLAATLDELAMGTLTGLPLDQLDLEVAAAAEGDVERDVSDATPLARARHASIHEPEGAVERLVARDRCLQVAHDMADLRDWWQTQCRKWRWLAHRWPCL
jgi:hypothetical protein